MSAMRAEHDKLVPMASGNAWYSSVTSVGLQGCIGLNQMSPTSHIQTCSVTHSIYCRCKETLSETLIVPCELFVSLPPNALGMF